MAARSTHNDQWMFEPVFAQIKTNRHIDRFRTRRTRRARSEWRLIAATHNLLLDPGGLQRVTVELKSRELCGTASRERVARVSRRAYGAPAA
jgi:hypothetical protein